MNTPLVSICIPVLNGEKYLNEALSSIELQSYQNIEVIISDNGSKDSSMDICLEYKTTSKYPVRIYDHHTMGIGENWNNCVTKSNGEYLKFLFQDDVLYPNCVEDLIWIFNQYEDIGLVACKREILTDNPESAWQRKWIVRYGDLQEKMFQNDWDKKILDRSILKKKEFFKDPFNKIGEPTAVMLKKSIFNEVGLFNTELKIVLDIEFYYRVLIKSRIIIVNKTLVGFRLHEEQASKKGVNVHKKEFDLYINILIKEYFWELSISHKMQVLRRKFIQLLKF
ncbi:glycosyltransferase family 2 protein [Christiangramia sp. SM2212]|uniref:Glycosyltransferase n=1 Tax=Christiangramia sediminicola TaxID=3073267 RepID=A0ABU1EMT6_9FLAO|nr:glycosyltransferase [Christiangramia sp. SM2212]MDR5589694.1 glycosyltransferase [Christiangramia sp. SM2212]